MLFIHGRIPSLENCIFESVLPPLIFQVATKGLVMDAHRVTLNMLKRMVLHLDLDIVSGV